MKEKIEFEKKKKTREAISLRLEPIIVEKLRDIANKHGVSLTSVVEMAIKKTYK